MSKKSAIIFSIIVALQLVMLVGYMQTRTSLFYDEIWSYGMANSYDSPFLYEKGFTSDRNNLFYNHWNDGKRYFEYITVQPEERFSYGKVYDNQMADLHPPLYYFLLHTICSFFPNTFSRWFGQIICLIAFVFVQIALFKLARQLFDNDVMALVMCAYFGFSMAAVNNFIYVRMYCLVTLWYICITYIALKICKSNQITTANGWLLFMFGFLGFMTHNHFAVYYFCLCLACGAYFVARKEFGLLWRFAALAMLSFCAYYIVFPGIFKQASYLSFAGKCGGIPGPFPIKTLFANMAMICNYTFAASADKIFILAADIVGFTGEGFEFLPVWLFLLIFALLEAILVYKRKFDDCWLVMFLTVSSYIVILSSYTILIRNGLYLGRYVFSILPCFALLVFGAVYKFVGLLKSLKWNKQLFFGIIMILSAATHYASAGEWCFDVPPHREEIAERFRDASIIFVIEPTGMPDALIHGKCQDFMYTKKVFVTRPSNVEEIFTAIMECDPGDKNLIVLPATEAGKNIFKAIPMLTDKQPVYEFTDRTNVCDFYVLRL